MTRNLTKLGVVLISMLVLAELALRAVGAVMLAADSRPTDLGAAEEGDRLVLCMGDSVVYGSWEESEDTYPGQLQELLEGAGPEGARVLNLGVPGWKSYEVLDRLRDVLDEHRPEFVFTTVGHNNSWGWSSDRRLADPPWYEHLRLVKLARMIAEPSEGAAAAPADFVEDRTGEEMVRARTHDEDDTYTPIPDYAWKLKKDLQSIVSLCRASGSEPVLVAYPTDRGRFEEANALLREFAAETEVPLIDPVPPVERLVDEIGGDAVFHVDLHPRRPGYTVVARMAYNHLARAGFVEGSELDLHRGLEAEGLERNVAVLGHLEGAPGTDDELRIELNGGEPGGSFRLVMYGLSEHEEAEEPFWPEMAEDPLFQVTANSDGLLGEFDDAGSAVVRLGSLTEEQRSLLAERYVWVNYLRRQKKTNMFGTGVRARIR